MEWLTGLAPISLIVLLCPLIMWFMMRGMHDERGHAADHSSDSGLTADGPRQEVVALKREVADLRRELAARSRLPSATEHPTGTGSTEGRDGHVVGS